MPDQAYVETKYFIDGTVYNCPFCNRKNVAYTVTGCKGFDWTDTKQCNTIHVKCNSCHKTSLHLCYSDIVEEFLHAGRTHYRFKADVDIDSMIFYSVPTSYFMMDARIPKRIRELVVEAEGCLKMGYLTGASACAKKAIYELFTFECAEGEDYESQLSCLKSKYPQSDPELFDTLAHIRGIAVENIHKQFSPQWDTENLRLILETLKAVLVDMYVIPVVKRERFQKIQRIREKVEEKEKRGEKSTGAGA